jgi:hypothetical protein
MRTSLYISFFFFKFTLFQYEMSENNQAIPYHFHISLYGKAIQYVNASVFSSEYSSSSEIMLASFATSKSDDAPFARISDAASLSQKRQNESRIAKSSASNASVQWR